MKQLPRASHWFLLAMAGNNEDIASFLLTEILRENKLNFYAKNQKVQEEIKKNFKQKSFPAFLASLTARERDELNRRAMISGLDPPDEMARLLLLNQGGGGTAREVLSRALHLEGDLLTESKSWINPETMKTIQEIVGPVTEQRLNDIINMIIQVKEIDPRTTTGLNRLVDGIVEYETLGRMELD